MKNQEYYVLTSNYFDPDNTPEEGLLLDGNKIHGFPNINQALKVELNGVPLSPGKDYTTYKDTIVFITPPEAGNRLLLCYSEGKDTQYIVKILKVTHKKITYIDRHKKIFTTDLNHFSNHFKHIPKLKGELLYG